MSRLLCLADIHLGAGSQYPGRLHDQETVLQKIVELAITRDVDGVLIAGDIFNGPAITPEQLQVFAGFIARLRESAIPILACTGNGAHDAAVREVNGVAIFNHIDGIDVHSQPGWVEFAGCAVALLPWVHPGRLIARAGRDVPRDEVNALCADLLVEVVRDLHDTIAAMPISGSLPKILLTHWSISGTALPAGLPVEDLREPVIPVEALEAVGFDHIVAGHIHRPQTIGSTGFYVGSPLPLNHGEAHVGVGHGVAILHVGERQEIDFPGAEYVEIDSPRFVTVGLSIDDVHGAVLDCDDDVTDAIVRVRFTATSEQMRRIDIPQLRALLLAAGARVVKVEPEIVREQRARLAGVDEQLDELAALDLWLQANAILDDVASAMRAKTRDYLQVVA